MERAPPDSFGTMHDRINQRHQLEQRMTALTSAIKRYLRTPGKEQLQAKVHATVGFLRAQPSPILVYQMGKVGSTSVCRSLEAVGLHPLHLHFLTDENWEFVRAAYQEVGMKPAHYYTERMLRPYLRWTRHRLKVISLVRDPIARYVSSLFQWPLLREDEANNADAMRADIVDLLSHPNALDYEFTWFDKELKPTFDVDVMQMPFSRDEGYAIYHAPRADILVLKVERLSELLPTVVSDFVGTPLHTVRANVGREKSAGGLYSDIKRTLQLPTSVCQAVYRHEWVRHFYSPSETRAFLRKWSAPNRTIA